LAANHRRIPAVSGALRLPNDRLTDVCAPGGAMAMQDDVGRLCEARE
jgi:hypothetical protein